MRCCVWSWIRASIAIVYSESVAIWCSQVKRWIVFPVDLRNRYGSPISRQRVYLIMVRRDVMSDEVKNQEFQTYIKEKLDAMKVDPKCGWFLIWMFDAFFIQITFLCPGPNQIYHTFLQEGLAASWRSSGSFPGHAQASQPKVQDEVSWI